MMTAGRPAMLMRRRVLALLALASGSRAAWAQVDDKALPPSRSLPAEVAQALAARQPLVVMINLVGCPWCKLVRENYLAPMHTREGLPVVQIDMRSDQLTQTALGENTTHAELVRAWGVTMAPTLLFLGAGGKEVAERLEGALPDFYSAYLDQRLEQARRVIAQDG